MVAALVFSVSQSALSCAPAEAQFIAKVGAVQKAGTSCLVQITGLTHYAESGVCPLNSAEALSSLIEVPNCSNLRVGSPISGYLSMGADGSIVLN